MEIIKTIEASKTEHTQIVFSDAINGSGRLFGGKLVEWMDIVAAVVARRHSECQVTTVSIDKMDFAQPAMLNDTIIIIGKMKSVGNTSMHVRVKAYVEKLSGERITINTASFIMVALGADGHPCTVPRLKEKTK